MTDSCATCFFVRLIGSNRYECHFYPPNPNILQGPSWREVQTTDWCGEFSITGPTSAWQTYVVSIGNAASAAPTAGALTTVTTSVWWQPSGKTIFYSASILLTDVGTGSGVLFLPAPVTGMKQPLVAGAGYVSPGAVTCAVFASANRIQIATQVGLYTNLNTVYVSGMYEII